MHGESARFLVAGQNVFCRSQEGEGLQDPQHWGEAQRIQPEETSVSVTVSRGSVSATEQMFLER